MPSPTGSPVDRLPNEILYRTLSFVMADDVPFDMSKGLHVATAASRPKAPAYLSNAGAVLLVKSYTETKDMCKMWKGDGSKTDEQMCLTDWHIAGSVCRRFRAIGKVAFFSNKNIAVDLETFEQLSQGTLTGFSTEDQRTACKCIRSIILKFSYLTSPSPFIMLARHLSKFTHLESVTFAFRTAGTRGQGRLLLVEERIQAPSHFIECLNTLGVPTKKLNINIMLTGSSDGTHPESALIKVVYPTLKVWTALKAERSTKAAIQSKDSPPKETLSDQSELHARGGGSRNTKKG